MPCAGPDRPPFSGLLNTTAQVVFPAFIRPELEAAVVAADRHLTKLFEGWIVATPDRRKFAVRIKSYPELDISVPFDWSATWAEVTERVEQPLPRRVSGSDPVSSGWRTPGKCC